MTTTTKKTEPRFTLEEIACAISYWNEHSAMRYTSTAVVIKLDSGEVHVSPATMKRGIRRLAALAARSAIEGGHDSETAMPTKHGKGFLPRCPGAQLDDIDRDCLDVIAQMGAFGCLIFG